MAGQSDDTSAYQSNPYGVQDPSALFQQLTDENSKDHSPTGGIRQSILNLGGNPTMNHALEVQQHMQTILNNTPQQDGEDPMDYQLRQARAVGAGMLNVDPATAMRANQQVLRLEQAKQQQANLSSEIAERDANTGIKKEAIAKGALNGAVLVRMDQKDQFGFPIPEQYGSSVQMFNSDGSLRQEYPGELQEQLAAAKAAGIPVQVRSTEDFNADKMRIAELRAQSAAQQAYLRGLATIKAAEIRGPTGGAVTLDQPTIHNLAVQSAYDPRVVNQSLSGNSNSANRAAIATEQTRYLADAGVEPEDLAGWRAQIKADTHTMSVMATNLGQLTVADQLVRGNGERIMALIQDVDVTGVPFIEGYRRNLISKYGYSVDDANVKVNELKSLITTWQPEVARIISGNPNMTGILSDTARHEIESIASMKLDAPSLINNIKRVLAETEFKKQGYVSEIGQLRGDIKALPGHPNTAPPMANPDSMAKGNAGNVKTPAPASQQDTVAVKGPNGETGRVSRAQWEATTDKQGWTLNE